MPLFAYRCQDCGKVTEFLQKADHDPGELHCSACGSGNLTKMISTFSVKFGGSGHEHKHEHGKELCCGRDERLPECVPGSCCGGKH